MGIEGGRGCLEFLWGYIGPGGACHRGSDVVLVESWREGMPPEQVLRRAPYYSSISGT
jgi:hypothetical protein